MDEGYQNVRFQEPAELFKVRMVDDNNTALSSMRFSRLFQKCVGNKHMYP